MNIILEGPDGSGKTTLAGKLFVGRDHAKFHNGLHEEPFHAYLDQAMEVLKNPSTGYLWDRFWPSNLIYGPITGGKALTAKEVYLLRFITIHMNTIIVLCLPSWEVVRDNWRANLENEMVKDELVIRKIYLEYSSSTFGIPQIVINPFELSAEEILTRVTQHTKWTE